MIVKIDRNKPLPEHTKLRYEECYAKLLLEILIAKYSSGLLIQDKPDLYSEKLNVGIEVTDIMSKEKKEALKLWYTMPYVTKSKQLKNIERMKQLGVDYQGGMQFWPTIYYDKGIESKPYIEFYDSLKCKLEKLNNNYYKNCRQCECLFFSELWVRDQDEISLFKRIKEIQNSFLNKFTSVYLVTQSYLYHFDFSIDKLKKFLFHGHNSYIAEKARDMVIEEEEK